MADEYGPIAFSSDYLDRLRRLVPAQDELREAAYIVEQLSSQDLEYKRRCVRCSRPMKTRYRTRTHQAPHSAASASTQGPSVSQLKPRAPVMSNTLDELTFPSSSSKKKPDDRNAGKPRCQFHPGTIFRKKWTCCDKHVSSEGCTGEKNHSAIQYAVGELEISWIFYATPAAPTPSQPAAAVVIDCEMGTSFTGESELIRVSVVDYFSRRVLLDRLVLPDVRMSHYNTKFSGISRQMMNDAVRHGNCFLGRDEARIATMKLLSPNTIVVGHALHQDLTSLRWIHPLVIDTLLIEKKRRKVEREAQEAEAAAHGSATQQEKKSEDEKEAAPNREAGMSLKALSKEKLNREIQLKGRGHDSVEDALATRDLLHWYMSHPAKVGRQ
ncbi:RNA exonuclease [Ophiocordyceps camponoti-floridani]|uniref:RNA exonuclease n=1 Tax=Ophiocordyceps camponoti-floridani TaxID=2030778 RepID=A0A8H4Q7S6_9HYPO|nr:RNA exonuclease [Ophiocordyceps camponoti-floridani]